MVIWSAPMINRIRDLRKSKGMTLADLAAACDPPTTAQTIGRLETGMRSLSTRWMERIARALEIDPELLVRSDQSPRASVIASLHARSEEHTSELQSLMCISYAVFCLKKTNQYKNI